MYEDCDTSNKIDRDNLLSRYYRRTSTETDDKDGLLRYEVKIENTPDKLRKSIQEKLDDVLVGGALSRETKIAALHKSLADVTE